MNLTVFVTYNEIEYVVHGRYVPMMKAVITNDPYTSSPADGGYWCDEIIEPEPDREEDTVAILELATEKAEMILEG
jgi:hypothetical protein